MKKILLLFLSALMYCSCTSTTENSDWTNLLDPELSHWDTYLSYKFTNAYNGEVPTDENGNEIPPIGLNQPGQDVFTIFQENNETVLKVSGEIYGCVRTKKEYANYHLRLKVKWGDKKYEPRKQLLKDSGIMYHSVGALGVDYWRSWSLSQEFQIMSGHMGDFWSQMNSAIDVRAYQPEYIMNPVAGMDQPFISIGQGEEIDGFCLRSNNYEKPEGEWNTLELICYGDKSIHIVNGHVVMVLKNSRYVENGQAIPLDKGKIILQSEATEVYYKDIEIRSLESLPDEYEALYKISNSKY